MMLDSPEKQAAKRRASEKMLILARRNQISFFIKSIRARGAIIIW